MYQRKETQRDVFLSVVIPVYRSEPCLPTLAAELVAALEPTGWEYEVILVNDFSPDGSWNAIEAICAADHHFVGVDLRRNFGQDNAILTGFRLARGACVAVMDDDLQHDPKYLPRLVDRLTSNVDIVYADFAAKHQKAWKNAGSWLNGKIADWVLYKPPHIYLSPYKVIRKEVVDMVCHYPGATPYIDGLLFQATWRIGTLPVEHHTRYAGASNYGFWRSAGLAARLVFSFSPRPVRLIFVIGTVTAAIGAMMGITLLAVSILSPSLVEGAGAPRWALGLLIAILLTTGLQMMFIGIVGEYAGRIYLGINRKPQTSVRTITGRQNAADLAREVTIGLDADL